MRARGEPELRPPVRAVLVVIPARDEEEEIGGALDALAGAVLGVGVPVSVTVVLDRCRDRTGERVAEAGERHPGLDLRSQVAASGTLGGARAEGVATARTAYPDLRSEEVWVACTDADSRVPAHWLQGQIELADHGLDLVLGTVEPMEDGSHPESTRLWLAQHHLAEGHTAIHGANLGVRLSAYDAAGGFPGADAHEDAQLVHTVREVLGLPWTSTDRTRVLTSARRQGRADAGFAHFLRRLDEVVEEHGVTEELQARLRVEILRLVELRGRNRSICPSEAAAAVDPTRRQALTHVARAVACQLADEGRVVLTQRGVVVDGRTTPGPVRIRLA